MTGRPKKLTRDQENKLKVEIINNNKSTNTLNTIKQLISPRKIDDFDIIHFIDGGISYMFQKQQNEWYQVERGKSILIDESQLASKVTHLESLGYRIKCLRLLKEDTNNVMVVVFD